MDSAFFSCLLITLGIAALAEPASANITPLSG